MNECGFIRRPFPGTWYRNCAICWDPIHQCNGFVVGNPLTDPETCRELCGCCAILFMSELRAMIADSTIDGLAVRC